MRNAMHCSYHNEPHHFLADACKAFRLRGFGSNMGHPGLKAPRSSCHAVRSSLLGIWDTIPTYEGPSCACVLPVLYGSLHSLNITAMLCAQSARIVDHVAFPSQLLEHLNWIMRLWLSFNDLSLPVSSRLCTTLIGR